ncbi:family 10 glycosylhydrolase [Oscillatoriales cyanobacterium LEGE 11467]|uniref:Family 10 glycosylhydrolase n=1 Tax=Zarconia navalis LEGE 11467 TaxID=1828826 RepID=A0A928VS85_9CYAN|nr:family 10 glycosylhydrolase [Zarconia navalis]MBE9039439.1 family 10 glycosylhydrolase [Zarconia navalis LEGE 11467]
MTNWPLKTVPAKIFLAVSSLVAGGSVSEIEPILAAAHPVSGQQIDREPIVQVVPTEDDVSDPASQVAPPGLQVEPGDAPIPPFEQLKMHRELRSLLGRVQSALLAANANSHVVGSHTKGSDGEAVSTGAPTAQTDRAIANARQVLHEFNDLVSEGKYAQARSSWLTARSSLWESYPNDRPRAVPEVRAIWLDRGTIVDAGSPEGLARVFDRLQQAGINTVFFETINAGYPIYPSRVMPEQNPLINNWDPLESAVELARERDMELHAWMWTFAVGNQRHNQIVGEKDDYPGPVLSQNPDWANYDNSGRMRHLGSGKTFLDPANPEARWYLLRAIDEIVTNYDVDGLQLDYIRYPFQDPSAKRTYGYGIAAREAFEELAGIDPSDISPDDRDLWEQWTEFRTGQVDSFVAEVSQWLRDRDPNLILSVAVFYQSTHDRIHKIQQHWENWVEDGTVDLVVPMTYARDTNRLESITEPLLERGGSALVVPSVKLHDLLAIVAIDQIQALRDLPVGGYALFAATVLTDPLYEIFTRTQAPTSTGPIPFRQPFETAATRFTALQQEWDVLLADDRLWIREPELSQWQASTAELAQVLDRLAAEPNGSNLAVASERLAEYQTGFEDWMRLEASEHSYQVQTWEHRLETLATLLRYGDRVILNRILAAR